VGEQEKGKLRARERLLVFLERECELERVIERVTRRIGLRLNTEMVSCDDGQEWEGWRIGLEKKIGI
jgi:hypothetical protein